jgi:hypothetical protein
VFVELLKFAHEEKKPWSSLTCKLNRIIKIGSFSFFIAFVGAQQKFIFLSA